MSCNFHDGVWVDGVWVALFESFEDLLFPCGGNAVDTLCVCLVRGPERSMCFAAEVAANFYERVKVVFMSYVCGGEAVFEGGSVSWFV